MSKNIIRIQAREDGMGYNITESGFQITGNDPFLLISESYLIKKDNTYLICFERAIPATKSTPLKKDIESIVIETSVDKTYAHNQTLNLARNEAKKILEERHSQGYTIEDCTLLVQQ